MSFEAVPCMFKSRQEDGNEAQLFGLLIRPAGGGNGVVAQQAPPGALSLANIASGPSFSSSSSSTIQIVPNPATVLDNKDCRNVPRPMLQMPGVAKCPAALFAGSNGMPPILPRPKQQKTGATSSKMVKKAMMPTTKGVGGGVGNETTRATASMAQSPSQVVPQLANAIVAGACGDVLSVVTAASSSSSSNSSSPPSSSSTPPVQHSPNSSSASSSASSSSSSNSGLLVPIPPPPPAGTKAKGNTARRRKSNKTEEKTEGGGGGGKKKQGMMMLGMEAEQNGGGGQSAGGGGDLLGDLHSIDYSQLVNSTVITTEDYLTSQSDPIYTNMDMYNPSLNQQQDGGAGKGGACQTRQEDGGGQHRATTNYGQQQQQQQGHIAVSSSSSSSLCPSAIFLHNQQHHHHPSTSSSTSSFPPLHPHPHHPSASSVSSSASTVRYNNGPVPSSAMVPPAPQQQQWNPYMGAHPGGASHISSTPDSGIQSIDGSPPSVYTPPMVSPYASQVRSCESAHNGSGGGGSSAGHGGMMIPCSSSSSHPSTSGYPVPCSSSSSGFYAYGGEPTLLITAPMSPHQSAGAPALIIEQMPAAAAEGEASNDAADFSDMPRLVPVTHTEHDEEVAEEGSASGSREYEEPAAAEEERTRPRSAGGAKAAEVLFHQGMSIRELAECLSSNITPEQLKQLTSLIQRKAEEQQKKNREGEGGGGNNINKAGGERPEEQEGEDGPAGDGGRSKQKQQQMVTSVVEVGKRTKKRDEDDEEFGQNGPELSKKGTFGEKEEERRDEEKKEEDGKRRMKEELAAYRARVREQLAQKLGALVERVMSRMDECHLNIIQRKGAEEEEEGMKKMDGWPWPKMDWAQVHRRVEQKGGRWMPDDEEGGGRKVEKKRRGRKKKMVTKEEDEEEEEDERRKKKREEEAEEDGKRGRKKREEEEERGRRKTRDEAEEEERKRAGRKRKNKAEEAGKLRMKKSRGRGGGRMREEKKKEEEEEEEEEEGKNHKQATPPLILRIRAPTMPASTSALHTIKRATEQRRRGGGARQQHQNIHGTNRLSVPSASPRAKTRDRSHSIKSDKGITNAGATVTFQKRDRGKRQKANQLGDAERALVRREQYFLVRNLKRRSRKTSSKDLTGLKTLLSQLFDKFCAILDNYCPSSSISHGRMVELKRAVNLLFTSASAPSTDLLDQFDSLLSEFISFSVPGSHRDSVRAQFLQLKQSVNFSVIVPPVPKNAIQAFVEHESRPRASTLPASSSVVKRSSLASAAPGRALPLTVDTNIDLSYLDSPHPVGEWDPDRAAKLSPTSDNRDHDCVRCVCGMAEDDGLMSQCDRCHFWLHADCMDCPEVADDQKEFVCEFCTRGLDTTPRVDIVQNPQPRIKLSGCTYYRTLVNAQGLQVRLNESVYVQRLINDKHKSILRELHEECVRKQQIVSGTGVGTPSPMKSGGGGRGRRKTMEGTTMNRRNGKTEDEKNEEEGKKQRISNRWWSDVEFESSSSSSHHFHRRDLRIFRVERLFISPNGQRFIFGCYYARPHETFCDSSRMFYRNELFWTPLFDTLPLDSVVGRCLILEPQIWTMGRPKTPRYLEDDVFVCEYQIDRNQRSFEKIHPKNRYYVNTEPYMFNMFEKKLEMRRTFTPFQVSGSNEMASSSSSRASSRMADGHLPTAALLSSLACRRRILQQNIDCTILDKIQKKKEKSDEERHKAEHHTHVTHDMVKTPKVENEQ